MSRIRTIKPEWLDDEGLHEAGLVARLMSVALITLSDDYGNGRAHVGQLAGRLFWAEENGPKMVREGLAKLVDHGFLSLYEVRGQSYFHICNWDKHQRVDKPGKPRCPGPEDTETPCNTDILETPEKIRETPENVPGTLVPDRDPDRDPDRERDQCAREPAALTPKPTPRSLARFEDPIGDMPPLPMLRFVHRLWLLFVRHHGTDETMTEERLRLDGKAQGRLRELADWAAETADAHATGDDWTEVASAALTRSLEVYERELDRRGDLSLHPGFWYAKRELWAREAA